MSPLTAMSPSAAAAQPAMGSLPATPTAPAIAPHENLGGVVIRYTPLLRQKLSGKWKKTAPNSYMLFRLDHIKVLKGQRIPANQINDMMSDWWDKLCTSKKNAYKEASRILQKHLDGINGPDGSVDHGPQRRPRAPRRHTGERPATAPTAYPRPPMTPPARPPTFAP
ncbi:hypothetical protein H4R18_001751 [Coemansia javaensis]|uniref:HMG box domain-containing protein n=1 Tax=Coemansia javaensis TaxID=2761396 RepID=A0A9W8LIR5_9FUNG|nr:hypothetical protein H4R18_001751 [Coemansia javaensis]